jgi:hypothetical protein
MPIRFERDDERRRLTVTASGPVTVSDVAEFISNQQAIGAWTYSVLLDAREADIVGFDREQVSGLADHLATVAGGRRRGPVAAVADAESSAELTRIYVALCSRVSGLVIGVFHDFASAEEWLAQIPPPC